MSRRNYSPAEQKQFLANEYAIAFLKPSQPVRLAFDAVSRCDMRDRCWINVQPNILFTGH